MATAVQEPTRTSKSRPRGNALAGTGVLVRLILRRDRVKLPVWLLSITLLLAFLESVASEVAGTEERQQDVLRFMEGAVGALFGPGYGRENITPDVYLAGVYAMFFFIPAALMSMLLVSRHTRFDEQNGRTELVCSNVVGRHSQLTAVLMVAVATNAVLALLLGGVMAANGHAAGDGVLFGAGVGAVGLVFAGITALTVQVTEYSRVAVGLAGALLGGSWMVRAVGDMIGDHGSLLSWFSPLAWSHQTRAYVDGRWWPLLLSVGLAVVTAAIAYMLAIRRDVGAGLVAASAGRPGAAPWLKSPLTAAFRLQRASLVGWTAALAAFGFVFGGISAQIADPADISTDRVDMFGGSLETLVDGYLSVITLMTAVLVSTMVVLGVQAVRWEESKGRAEPMLATATSRWAWMGSHLAVMALGVVGVLLVAGFTNGVGAAIAVDDAGYVGDMVAAHLAHAPGVLVLLGIAALLFGVFPKAIGIIWVMLGYSLFVGVFGVLVDTPQWARNLLPMEHVGKPPLDSIAWPATTILLAVAAGLVVVGLAWFRRRDLESK